jgi:mannose-6-phosphate isomerase class I
VRCEHFSFERAGLSAGAQTPVEGGRPRIVACIEGAGQLVDSGQAPVELVTGESCLVPACLSAQLASRAGGVFLVIRA